MLDDELLLAGASYEELLPTWQRADVAAVVQLHGASHIAAAEVWLGLAGPADTVPFGGAGDVSRIFLDNLLLEMKKMVCTGEGYENERKQLNSEVGPVVVATALVGYLAAHFGAGVAIIGPVVSLVLRAVSTAGQRTFCGGLQQIIDQRGAAELD